MLTLAFDTSGPWLAVGVLDGDATLAERLEAVDRSHAERLLPALAETLAEAGASKEAIGRVVVGLGPGGFTSVRVGVATAKGLGLALGVPVHGVSTLEALARGAATAGAVAVLNDARRGDVFAAVYELEGGRARARLEPCLLSAEVVAACVRDAIAPGTKLLLVGDARARFPDASAFGDARWADATADRPSASRLARAAAGTAPSDLTRLEPLYVRATDAKLPAMPQRTSEE